MAESLDNVSELRSLANGTVTYKVLKKVKGRLTVIAYVNDELHYGHGFSFETAKSDAAANALRAMKTEKLDSENKSAFFTLKEKRKGLIFQVIKKHKLHFDVMVQVDYVKYFGKGETQQIANNNCAASVLAALESGQHEKTTHELYKNSFITLKETYGGLLYKTIGGASSDGTYNVYVSVDGIDYIGEGQSVQEANNDAAWAALKSIWSGDHKQRLDQNDEYWYDEDDYLSSTTSKLSLSCDCSCHSCICCDF